MLRGIFFKGFCKFEPCRRQENPLEIDKAFRDQWRKEHPLAYVEHRQHWHPEGEFGAWVASHNTVIRSNRSLFVHAGISPAYADRSAKDINEAVRSELLAATWQACSSKTLRSTLCSAVSGCPSRSQMRAYSTTTGRSIRSSPM